MSYVSEIKDICGDYQIDVKYHEEQKSAISLYFNSRRNAATVKRCIEVDDSVPNAATAVDFVEVVRCADCRFCSKLDVVDVCEHPKNVMINESNPKRVHVLAVGREHYCSYGERRA